MHALITSVNGAQIGAPETISASPAPTAAAMQAYGVGSMLAAK